MNYTSLAKCRKTQPQSLEKLPLIVKFPAFLVDGKPDPCPDLWNTGVIFSSLIGYIFFSCLSWLLPLLIKLCSTVHT